MENSKNAYDNQQELKGGGDPQISQQGFQDFSSEFSERSDRQQQDYSPISQSIHAEMENYNRFSHNKFQQSSFRPRMVGGSVRQNSNELEKQHVENQSKVQGSKENNIENFNISANHSIVADMTKGWKPQLLRDTPPVPIPVSFENPETRFILQRLFNNYRFSVLYLGSKSTNSYDLFREMLSRENQAFKYGNIVFNKDVLKKFNIVFPQNSEIDESYPFVGMNPDYPQYSLSFDSQFESGNLQCVIQISDTEFDLFMRVDSNTQGHMNWFYFKVFNTRKREQIKFNICNFTKKKNLFANGLRPYTCSKIEGNEEWVQSGVNITYSKRKNLKYEYLPSQQNLYILSFQYEFKHDGDTVSFATLPPFTFSQCNIYKKLIQEYGSQFVFKEEILTKSLAGLSIPLFTITAFDSPGFKIKNRKLILILARTHPGETVGSWMAHGLIQYLLEINNDQSEKLRQKFIFKVIPLLNVDGVVAGNHRTGLEGSDLNRNFNNQNISLFPSINAVRQLILSLQQEFKERFFGFFDFHGHSFKKGIFTYGPLYKTQDFRYFQTRFVPYILSKNNETFSYRNCLFNYKEAKIDTARYFVQQNIGIEICYTLEGSYGIYLNSQSEKQELSVQSWMQMGKSVLLSIKQVDDMYEIYENIKETFRKKDSFIRYTSPSENKKIQKKSKQRKHTEMNQQSSCKTLSPLNFQESSSPKQQVATMNNIKTSDQKSPHQDEPSFVDCKSPIYIDQREYFNFKSIIQEIEEKQNQIEKQQGDGEDAEYDQFSDVHSDSESSDEDLPANIINKIHSNIEKYVQNFSKQITDFSSKGITKLLIQNPLQIIVPSMQRNASNQEKKSFLGQSIKRRKRDESADIVLKRIQNHQQKEKYFIDEPSLSNNLTQPLIGEMDDNEGLSRDQNQQLIQGNKFNIKARNHSRQAEERRQQYLGENKIDLSATHIYQRKNNRKRQPLQMSIIGDRSLIEKLQENSIENPLGSPTPSNISPNIGQFGMIISGMEVPIVSNHDYHSNLIRVTTNEKFNDKQLKDFESIYVAAGKESSSFNIDGVNNKLYSSVLKKTLNTKKSPISNYDKFLQQTISKSRASDDYTDMNSNTNGNSINNGGQKAIQLVNFNQSTGVFLRNYNSPSLNVNNKYGSNQVEPNQNINITYNHTSQPTAVHNLHIHYMNDNTNINNSSNNVNHHSFTQNKKSKSIHVPAVNIGGNNSVNININNIQNVTNNNNILVLPSINNANSNATNMNFNNNNHNTITGGILNVSNNIINIINVNYDKNYNSFPSQNLQEHQNSNNYYNGGLANNGQNILQSNKLFQNQQDEFKERSSIYEKPFQNSSPSNATPIKTILYQINHTKDTRQSDSDNKKLEKAKAPQDSAANTVSNYQHFQQQRIKNLNSINKAINQNKLNTSNEIQGSKSLNNSYIPFDLNPQNSILNFNNHSNFDYQIKNSQVSNVTIQRQLN